MKRKLIKIILLIALIFFLGGVGGFVFDRFFVPYLGSCRLFSGYDIFQGAGKNTTIIKETERVVVKDDNSANELASSGAQSVVDVISKTETEGKLGTGTVLTNDGVIVTHKSNVFEEIADYQIVVSSGTVYKANLVGIDIFSELAFLKVEGVNLPAIPFANSDDVIIGKKVIALGSSVGKDQVSITEAIFSDYDDTFNLAGINFSSSEKLEGVFRSNFSGNDKYIGGPVINFSGELVAITSFIEADNKKEYFQIPSNKVKRAMNEVFAGNADKAAKLGVYYISISESVSILRDLSVSHGAMVYSPSGLQGLAIIAKSPAEKSGIKINDIILSVNGEEINLENSLSSLINKYKVGDKIELAVLRAGKEIKLEVAL